MKVLKNYMFARAILVTFFLTGCVNEKIENAEPSKLSTDENNKLSDIKATPLQLTPEQKEKYYKEYISLVEKVNEKYNVNFVIEPISKFTDEYWVEVKDFEKMLKERVDASIIVSKINDAYSPTFVPKTVEIHIGSKLEIISFEGSFETQLNFNKPYGRQLFSAMNSISSKIENGSGNWIQTGYNYSIVDGGRSYLITVAGKYSNRGISSPHIIEVEYYCNKNGGIT
ncbi:hypothetical protein [Lysinibacillus sp. NPDC093688]|uniref:hypothetical protein n=1 Tax=Lysinibacillus sp. NPDC093688 TaxID=3390577 RepID=UPI003D01C759